MGGCEAMQPGIIFSLFFYESLAIGDLALDMEIV